MSARDMVQVILEAAGFEVVAEDQACLHAAKSGRHVVVSWEGDDDAPLLFLTQDGPARPGERRRPDGPSVWADLSDPYGREKLDAWLAAGPDVWPEPAEDPEEPEEPTWGGEADDDGGELAFA